MTTMPIPAAGELMLLAAAFTHGDQERATDVLAHLVERGFAPVDIAYATVMLDVALAEYAGGEPAYRVLDPHTGLLIGIEDAEPPYQVAVQFAYAIVDAARAAGNDGSDAEIRTAQEAARRVYHDAVTGRPELARLVQQVLSTYLWSRSELDHLHVRPSS